MTTWRRDLEPSKAMRSAANRGLLILPVAAILAIGAYVASVSRSQVDKAPIQSVPTAATRMPTKGAALATANTAAPPTTLVAASDPPAALPERAPAASVAADPAAECRAVPQGSIGTAASRTPRDAAQLGLHWLECAALAWQKNQQCFGCHVQAQVLMGQSVALKHEYTVNLDALKTFAAFTRERQEPDGAWQNQAHFATAYAVMGLAFANDATGVRADPALLKGVDWLIAQQVGDGGMEGNNYDPPILQGRFLTSANAVVALAKAHEDTHEVRYRTAAERALAWIASATPQTTQDKTYKVLALARSGSAEQRRLVRPLVERLAMEQEADGGWKEDAELTGSNAYATGQVLYAFKQAGISIHSLVFTRGVRYLLQTQIHDSGTDKDGSWQARNTKSGRPSDFAPTMWAVIGLAGSFGMAETGGLQVVNAWLGDKPPARALEIVLDVSGSMRQPLGRSTRWQTALDVLREVIRKIPDDLDVGLRVYGHRESARSPATCTDTELLVPIGKLARARLLASVARLQPRGETPLIYSLLQTAEDFQGHGRASVILITDGEESCGGRPETVVERLRQSGIDVTLHIVGFALTAKAVEDQLATLAQATRGRFYGAQSREQLSQALALASIQSLPYEVLDVAGTKVAARETGLLAEELPPGQYRVVVNALGQQLQQRVVVERDKVTVVKVVLHGDKLALEM
jgi:hypothetical protein